MLPWDRYLTRLRNRNELTRQVEGLMFTGADRTTIHGGEFNTVRTDSVTINNSYNIHVPSTVRQGHLTRRAGHDVIGAPAVSGIGSGIQLPNNMVRSEPQASPLTGAPPFEILEWHEDSAGPPDFRERAASIFYERLLCYGLGLPIWNPILDRRLPTSYRRKGISVGDVGLITERGAFEYLFNITLPIAHPDNPGNLPQDLFSPLPALAVQIGKQPYPGPPCQSFSSQGVSVTYSEDGRGVSFRSSSSSVSQEGVIALPLGYNTYQIRNKISLRRHFSENALDWCAYAIREFGPDARNGDLCIVIGCVRCQACGLAAFEVPASGTVDLDFGAGREVRGIQTYYWRHIHNTGRGFQDHKTLPSVADFLELREGEASERDNLCIFLKTLKVRVRDDVWAKLESAPDSAYQSRVAEGGGGLSNTTNKSSHAGNYHGASESTKPGPGSPSDTINKYLLNAEPAAEIAMTSDDEWISVLKKDDPQFPDSEELIKRIRGNYTIELEDGMVFLEPKTPNSEFVSQKPLLRTVVSERNSAGSKNHHTINISRRVDSPTISTLLGGHPGDLVDSPDSDTGTAHSMECETPNSSAGSFQSLGGRTKVDSGSFSVDFKNLRTKTGDSIPEPPLLKQRRDGSHLTGQEGHYY